MTRMRRLNSVRLVLLALVLAAAGFMSFGFFRPEVDVVEVTRGQAIHAVPGNVFVSAAFVMELKSQVGGRVTESVLDTGQRVTKGEVVLQLDPGDLVLEIQRIENEFETARKRLAIGSAVEFELEAARDQLAELERGVARGVHPAAELDRHLRSIRQIEQRRAHEEINNRQMIASYENTLKQRRRDLEKMTLVAPVDGVIASIETRPGDLISAGAPLATIISDARVVEARISEENFAAVRVGQRAAVRLLGFGDTQFDARVMKILPTADPGTQRYTVVLEVAIEPERLIPGLTGEAIIIVGERDDALLIPRRALVGGRVLVVRKGRLEQQPVTTGYTGLNTAEVLSGVQEGERIVVNHLDRLRPGQGVRMVVRAP